MYEVAKKKEETKIATSIHNTNVIVERSGKTNKKLRQKRSVGGKDTEKER